MEELSDAIKSGNDVLDNKTDQVEADLKLQTLMGDLRKTTDALRALQRSRKSPSFSINTQLVDNPGRVNPSTGSATASLPAQPAPPSQSRPTGVSQAPSGDSSAAECSRRWQAYWACVQSCNSASDWIHCGTVCNTMPTACPART